MSDPYDLALTTADARQLTAEEQRHAALTVCDHAVDVAEARLLLDMLGLAGR